MTDLNKVLIFFTAIRLFLWQNKGSFLVKIRDFLPDSAGNDQKTVYNTLAIDLHVSITSKHRFKKRFEQFSTFFIFAWRSMGPKSGPFYIKNGRFLLFIIFRIYASKDIVLIFIIIVIIYNILACVNKFLEALIRLKFNIYGGFDLDQQ